MNRKTNLVIWSATAALALGCLPEMAPDEYREALPLQDDLKVKLGENDADDGTAQQGELDPFAECDECCVETDDNGEEWYVSGDIYEMTRSAKWHVNGGLVVTMGWVEAIVSSPVSEETDDGFIWGPWSENLSRITFRFVMAKETGDDFVFRLEGKNINDDSDNWATVLDGHVTAGDEPHHGTGTLVMDFGAIHDIDTSHPTFQDGVVTYDFDVREHPYVVDVKFDGLEVTDGEVLDALYHYERHEEMAGLFQFVAQADVTGPNDQLDGVYETLDVQSQWTRTGEGFGTATVSGGSLGGLSADTYIMTECWADSDGLFYQTYAHAEVSFTDGTPTFEETFCGALSHCPVFE